MAVSKGKAEVTERDATGNYAGDDESTLGVTARLAEIDASADKLSESVMAAEIAAEAYAIYMAHGGEEGRLEEE